MDKVNCLLDRYLKNIRPKIFCSVYFTNIHNCDVLFTLFKMEKRSIYSIYIFDTMQLFLLRKAGVWLLINRWCDTKNDAATEE